MLLKLQLLIFLLILPSLLLANPRKNNFSFHLPWEPHTLDIAKLRGSGSNYLFYNLYRSLYTYDDQKGLQPEGAKKCERPTPLSLRCYLNPKVKWSDGKPVVAADYVRSFRYLINPKSKTLRANLLFSLKNAIKILKGQLPPQKLGIKALSTYILEFKFEKFDGDFEYKLTSSILVPLRSTKFPSTNSAHKGFYNGPYQVHKWLPQKKMVLKPNPHYPFRSITQKTPPWVEVFFIREDNTAVLLYQKGKLSFLRRLPTLYIPKYQNNKDFFNHPVSRFDYLGFGRNLQPHLSARKALALAINYKELKILFRALGRPGCPSIPKSYMANVPCHSFNLKKAKKLWGEVSSKFKKSHITLYFSHLGGSDHRRMAEWLQQQWKKHLGFHIQLQQVEQKTFLRQLANNPQDIFRKGKGLNRPTCLAALETFSFESPENFIELQDSQYQKILTKMSKTQKIFEKKKLCSQGVEFLLNQALIIPMGRIHFSMMANPKFKGWKLNEMNQLDLSRLELTSK